MLRQRKCAVRLSAAEARDQAAFENSLRYTGRVRPELVFGPSVAIESSGAVRYGPLDRHGRAWHIAAEYKNIPRRRLLIDDGTREKMRSVDAQQRGWIGGNADTIAQEAGWGGQEISVDALLEDMAKPLVSPVDLLRGTGTPKECAHCGASLSASRRRIGEIVGTDAQYCPGGKCAKAAQNRRSYLRRKCGMNHAKHVDVTSSTMVE